MKRLKNQQGMILPSALFVLALLTFLGISSINTAQIELEISKNAMLATKAFYNAESGTDIVLMDARNLLKPYKSDWNKLPEIAATNENYSISNIQFSATIAPKLDENGQMELWQGFPVITITSTGKFGTAQSVVQITAHRDRLFAKVPSALYAAEGVSVSGQAARVDGRYRTGSFDCPDIDVVVNTKDVITALGSDSISTKTAANFCTAKICNSPPLTSDSGPPYPLAETVDKLKKEATIISGTPPKGSVFGSEDNPGIFYCPGNLSTNNITIYGILLAEGDVELAGNTDIRGLSFVKGTTTLKGGGSTAIFGAWLSQKPVTINGGLDIYYDCRVLQKLVDNLEFYTMTSWLQL